VLQQSPMEWSIDHAPIEGGIDATEAILKDSFQRWSLSSPAMPAAFWAKLRRHEFAGATLICTVTGPCIAQSPPGYSPFDNEFCLGLQLNLSGRVQLQHWDTPICEGDMFLWRTDQRQHYEVLERSHSVSLMIPWQLMREASTGPQAAARSQLY